MSPHVVVTGAGGFAGRFIAQFLCDRDMTVTATSRSSDVPASQGLLNWRRTDLRDPASLPAQFDALVHCAAEIPARCPDPKELYDRNIDAAQSVFAQAAAAGAQTVIFLSSMSVYGKITVPEVSENTTPQQPDSYGRAKLDAENALASRVPRDFKSALSLRLPGAVGRGSHHNFLSDSLARILRGETIHARNPDAPFNNIVYIGDLAAFICEWIDTPQPGYAVTNLAARAPMRMRDVYSLLFRSAGKPESIEYDGDGKGAFTISIERALSLHYSAPSVEQSVTAFVRDVLVADQTMNEIS